jgi:hypothetical protein
MARGFAIAKGAAGSQNVLVRVVLRDGWTAR